MIPNKKFLASLGLAFLALAMVALVGSAGLAVLVYELGGSNFAPADLIDRAAWQTQTGDEFTGEVTAWLFGASSVPVGVDLISRAAIRFAPIGETVKGFIRRLNTLQRKYLLPFHTYLSILALGLGLLHLSLSTCTANPLPEWGLILCGVLVVTGLLFKWKAVPATFRRALYQFHASLMVTGFLLVILFTGHAVMGTD
jgi:hypothetical protein